MSARHIHKKTFTMKGTGPPIPHILHISHIHCTYPLFLHFFMHIPSTLSPSTQNGLPGGFFSFHDIFTLFPLTTHFGFFPIPPQHHRFCTYGRYVQYVRNRFCTYRTFTLILHILHILCKDFIVCTKISLPVPPNFYFLFAAVWPLPSCYFAGQVAHTIDQILCSIQEMMELVEEPFQLQMVS